MEPEYDIFEINSNGALCWRTCVRGTEHAIRELRRIADKTDNECFATELQTQIILGRANEGRAHARILDDDGSALN